MTKLETYKRALQKISEYGIKPTGETELQRIKRLKSIADKALFIADVSGSVFNWKKFFSGGKIGINYECFYKDFIEEKRVEKHEFKGGVRYSIGNIDLAKKKFKTETELLNALKNEM